MGIYYQYTEVRSCEYKEDRYLVRDNGAIMCLSKESILKKAT